MLVAVNDRFDGALMTGYLPAEVLRVFALCSFLVVDQGAVECGRSQANQLGSHSHVPKLVAMLSSAKVGVEGKDVSEDQCGGRASCKSPDCLRTVREIFLFPNLRVIIQYSSNLL
jgi:hypothetical protein